jgi:integrase
MSSPDSRVAGLCVPDRDSVKGKRNYALLAMLLGCGLRRSELTRLTVSHLQQRDDHWAIIDLFGKGGHVRTVPVPAWVKVAVDTWLASAGVDTGIIFRCVSRTGRVWGNRLSEKAVWWVVREYAKLAGIGNLAPHDLRRTCARLCHSSGGELEQIQFLLGHRSVETTERYLGSRQDLYTQSTITSESNRWRTRRERFHLRFRELGGKQTWRAV